VYYPSLWNQYSIATVISFQYSIYASRRRALTWYTGSRTLSLSELQEQTGLSRSAVIAAKQALKGKGYL